MCINKLTLNPGKTKVLVVWIATKQVLDYQPVMNGVAFPLQEQVHWLGVLLDSS